MAENILKLRVDSQEYDNKIKRAAEGLQRYADGCRKAGGTLTQLDDGVLEFTRALGQMETVSKSAKGSVSELTRSFTDLSVIYNKLTDEEKNAPFGQALKGSLDELRGRIQSGNEEIKNISESLNGGGGLKDALNQVAGKFGLNIDMVTKFGGVIGVTTTALKVAKDAFFQSESNIDEWGRTVKGAEGAYDIFLQTLNNGNWSNFFSNLSQAITGARDLYDAFDRLNSIKANNAVAISMVQAEIQQLRVLKQQGQDVDDKIKDATARLARLQSQSANAGINAGRGQIVNTLRNGVNSIGGAPINDATLKYVADKIAKYGQSYIDGMKRQYTTLEKKGMVTKTETRTDSQGNSYEARFQVFDINALTKEQQKQYAVSKAVTERETEIQKGLSVWSQAVNEQAAAAREQFKGNRYALQGSGGSGGGNGGGSTVDIMSLLQSSWSKASGVGGEKAIELEGPSSAWSAYVEAIKTGSEEATDSIQSLIDAFKSLNNAEGTDIVNGLSDDAKVVKGSFKDAAGAVGSLGSALAGLDDPGAKIAGTVAQAIANIAAGFAASSLKDGETGNVWYWIAATAAGLANMMSVISAIHSSTGYAGGGEIKGNSYSGDNLMAMGPSGLIGLNAGEIVLNKAQQANIASGLKDGGRTINIVGMLKGEDIVMMADRYGMRTGRGELAFFKN